MNLISAMKLAKEIVFIQSPVFNASPIVEAVLETCKRGVTVILYIGLGFNDFAEGIVPFQGGTNDTVRGRLMTELSKLNKQQYLKWHWYVAKDQKAPLRFEKQSRNNHVKFLQVDGKVAIMGIASHKVHSNVRVG
jgi:phosphatidylserine/phosphatidylglycerophosphate/cardiolipin synthase-like enzyme